MRYKVFSPWAAVDNSGASPLSPRLETLEGKTIGLLAHFKEHSLLLLDEVHRQLAEKYPTTRFKHLQYKKDTSEIENDPEFKNTLTEWLRDVDAVISVYGDMGSCALFVGYNTAFIEKQGIPCVILADPEFVATAKRGAASRMVPAMRVVTTTMQDLSFLPVLDRHVIETIVEPAVSKALERIVAALTEPLTAEEQTVVMKSNEAAELMPEGTYEELNRLFYRNGWTNGSPIVLPTEEAVENMLRGTDLPRGHVVGYLPPMKGAATVEKIAVNAVMAGCLPTHMPILIAAVKAMLDPALHLEGYTCSRGVWAPIVILNGPIRKAVDVNTGICLFSPYRIASAAIGKALGYILMNISGVRPGIEDLSGMGDPGRFGAVIGENEEESPWESYQSKCGIEDEESSVTLFWPSENRYFRGREANEILLQMCTAKDFGFRPGVCFVISPEQAKELASKGWSKQGVLDFVTEYARRPASEVPLRWLRGNNHAPENIALPIDPSQSARCFWNQDHMLMIVAGCGYGAILTGGGDHGGPITQKIELPASWEELTREYSDISPRYMNY